MKKQKVILPFIILVIFIVMSIFVTYDGVHIARKNILGLFRDAKFAKELLTDKDKDEDEDKLLTGMGTARGLIWKYGLKFFLKKPIFGYGPDNLESEYLAENIEQDRPHNLVIQLLTTSGIVGFLLYAGAVRNYCN